MNAIIREALHKKRDTLKPSSLNTYTSILSNLFKRVFPDTEFDIKLFSEKADDILEHLEPLPFNKRKTILSALYILTENKKIHDLMLTDLSTHHSNEMKQEMTETQKDNWITQSEIKTIVNLYEKKVKAFLKEPALTKAEWEVYNSYIILCCMSGQYIEPRRLLDWSNMKVKDYDEKTDNYILVSNKGRTKTMTFVFNVYKTAKKYNQQRIVAPKELVKILTDYLQRLPDEEKFLLRDTRNGQMNPTKLNQSLNRIFGKKVGVNILRHSYLTELYKDIPQLEKLQQTATNMGHSINMAMQYVKKDANISNENVNLDEY